MKKSIKKPWIYRSITSITLIAPYLCSLWAKPSFAQSNLFTLANGAYLLCETPKQSLSPSSSLPAFDQTQTPLLGYSTCFSVIKENRTVSGTFFTPHSDFSICFKGSIDPSGASVSGKGASFEFGMDQPPSRAYAPDPFEYERISGKGTQVIQIEKSEVGYSAIFVYDQITLDLKSFTTVPFPDPSLGYRVRSADFLELPECKVIQEPLF